MKQYGKVVEVSEDKAFVIMEKHSSCSGCNACKLGSDNHELRIEAINTVGAKSDQIVEVDMEGQHVLTAAFILYMIPLFALFTGIVIGNIIFPTQELIAAAMGFGLLALSFLGIKMKDESFRNDKKYIPVITNIQEEKPL
ncbi:SoxR reducing system RseC family protein [Isachenkonia alkalipeptolytica]|uniref:Sigma E positive regulator RseC/MucC n=1 Tax=Isachenkonia alkalipeptolytica TaxID=2565777 RepID=A0AA43XL90_9CLOT|nr:SoxR reducing system RseC family protein [Isachenkonia alkalipeptolytica]NBG88908.1 sigma E positive regulator RseC/MucC [Isachenkonia alkalipeptolytica]